MTKSNILDDPAAIATADPSGMHERLLGLPRQARLGWELGSQARPIAAHWRPQQVVIAGMGGSAIGAALIRGIADQTGGAVPVTVWRDYGVPSWVGGETLVVAVSVSGGTVETRSAFRAAVRQNAKCLAITGRQELLGEAETAGVQSLRIDHHGEPRAALGFTFVAPFRALQRLGALPDATSEFEVALEDLERLARLLGPDVASATNPAKQLAVELSGRLPVTYGTRHLSGVAIRWKTQFNENADSWAIVEDMPETNHNGVQGYQLPGEVRGLASVLVLDSANLSEEMRVRLRLTTDLMNEEGVSHRLIDVGGNNLLADIMRGCLLGDMVSYYLALLSGRDPSRTAALTRLKDRTYASPEARG
jgi:glucose/mannose-6-phosphate isomerase